MSSRISLTGTARGLRTLLVTVLLSLSVLSSPLAAEVRQVRDEGPVQRFLTSFWERLTSPLAALAAGDTAAGGEIAPPLPPPPPRDSGTTTDGRQTIEPRG
jgi:hypothetical protein